MGSSLWDQLEARADTELEVLETVLRQRVEVLGVDEAQRRAEHRQEDPQLHARGGAQVRQVEGLVLAIDVARVGEQQHAERSAEQEMVLQIELGELVAA